jgi:hypothetical protein
MKVSKRGLNPSLKALNSKTYKVGDDHLLLALGEILIFLWGVKNAVGIE